MVLWDPMGIMKETFRLYEFTYTPTLLELPRLPRILPMVFI